MQIYGKEVTTDDLQNGYYIYQPAEGFRFGVDAVLLSEFSHIKQGESVLDMGTGTGIIPILLAAKTKGRHFTGLEIQEFSAAVAKESVLLNKLEERIDIVNGDIKEASKLFGNESFNVVVSNPPYMIADHGLRNNANEKYIARHEALCTFDDIAREASRVLISKGRFYLIHRPFRLAELFMTLKKYKLEPKRMRLVHSYVDKEPQMVMIEAAKGGNSGIKIEKPLIIYDKGGEYTEELKEIYK
ncbi:MAG: tRNA1(Val) (adenine(37)-N6)-methyltransferase [Candidatus Alectryocaccobium sp.]|jgi:tRNA1Val (adenine37-N6)-methyltransferase|nr:tRNA1(Val) (adenine(37)-N6)-methyltransferase [Lachnospiraceae bacterium]MDY6221614.1 tRNA1(Val) (adenine(37)-N6)-methyltransferase [Candidatus Alectryocaccobium sp.]